MASTTLAGIRANFQDGQPAGSVTGATIQQFVDFLQGQPAGYWTPATGLWQSGTEGFVSNLPGVVATGPLIGGASSVAWVSANRLYGARVTVPRACVLHDVAINLSVQSGNISVAIYDTGDGTPGTYTRLWTTGAISCPATGSWQVMTPDCALTCYAGQQLIFAMSCDNTTAAVLKNGYVGGAQLPTSYMVCGGTALPKPLILQATAHPAPSTITEANAVATGNYVPLIIARYV